MNLTTSSRLRSLFIISPSFIICAWQYSFTSRWSAVPINNGKTKIELPSQKRRRMSTSISSNSRQEQEQLQLSSSSTRPCHYSLWLMPPQPQREFLRQIIEKLSSSDKKFDDDAPHPFSPHITVVGNILTDQNDKISNGEWEGNEGNKHSVAVQRAIGIIRNDLKNFGPVECRFKTIPYFMPVWNQAAVLVMEEDNDSSSCDDVNKSSSNNNANNKFRMLCERVRLLLSMDTKHWDYPPPIQKPHLSLYYGTNNVPSKNQIIDNFGSSNIDEIANAEALRFQATQVAIWKTDPCNARGVSQWEEIDVINLV